MTNQPITITTGSLNITSTVGDINITAVVNAVSTSSSIGPDVKLTFDGGTGSTYLIYNTARNKLELYVSGAIQSEWG